MTRADRLAAFLSAVEGAPVVWGVDDCTMLSANWVKKETGIKLRIIPYSTKRQAAEVIIRCDGLLNIWDRTLSGHLLEQTCNPDVGDIGLVETATCGPVGMIFTGHGTAVWRQDTGYRYMAPRENTIIKAWQLPYEN